MDKKKIDHYNEGYSRGDLVKRIAAGASALLLCGSLTACGEPEKNIAGNMTVRIESDDCVSSEDELGLMGEEGYFPDGDEIESESVPVNISIDPTESVMYGQGQD